MAKRRITSPFQSKGGRTLWRSAMKGALKAVSPKRRSPYRRALRKDARLRRQVARQAESYVRSNKVFSPFKGDRKRDQWRAEMRATLERNPNLRAKNIRKALPSQDYLRLRKDIGAGAAEQLRRDRFNDRRRIRKEEVFRKAHQRTLALQHGYAGRVIHHTSMYERQPSAARMPAGRPTPEYTATQIRDMMRPPRRTIRNLLGKKK